jgi:alkanesulfonate monooxygenase SsuD/methylene tetrahydromethanopterin reductase-like flavin-dependent oxidoreductase (luciferase family)
VRCDPKPVQKSGPPILLGAHGPKGRERVLRTFDGWCPVVGKPETFKRDVTELKRMAAERGRASDSLQITAFVAPHQDGLSADELKFYRDAGTNRLVLFSQRDAVASADGQALEIIRRIAPTLDRAGHI